MIILYDGWSFIHDPNSPSVQHLMTLLARRPAEVQAQVALPGAPPPWLPEGIIPWIRPTASTPWKRLLWEHSFLPALAGHRKADLLHLTTPGPALFSRVPCVISPTWPWESLGKPARQDESSENGEHSPKGRGFFVRLRRSLGQGGLARARGLFWPADLPVPAEGATSPPVFRLPPAVHPEYAPPSMFAAQDLTALDLPETYLLYHGQRDLAALRRLLNAWSWAADAIGEAFPLVLLGFDGGSRRRVAELLPDISLENTLRVRPPVPFPWIAEIYRGCAALFHPSPISPWGNPVRNALACERPVVTAENPLTDALAGPAAYLAPAGDSRSLGAALITLVVEEQVSNQLIQAARRRAENWQSGEFAQALFAAYQAISFPS